MCICVNCEFYSTCWINSGLRNFPKYYDTLNQKLRSLKKRNTNLPSYIPLMLNIQLNVSTKSYKREPDIKFCDSFIEKPGSWLN